MYSCELSCVHRSSQFIEHGMWAESYPTFNEWNYFGTRAQRQNFVRNNGSPNKETSLFITGL